MVLIKIGAILTFLVVGGMLVNRANWVPFAPSGFAGIVTGGAIVFFTYIGFDSVSTAAEEARNPQRDLPIGIIASLIVCTLLYVGVSIVLLWLTLKLGVEVKGARRWVSFAGNTVQPSEFVKPAYAVIAAWLFSESMQKKGVLPRVIATLIMVSIVGALLLAVLVWNEARAEQPIMPLRLFTDRVRVGAYLTRLLYLGAMIGFFFFTSQLMQDLLGFSALQAGLGFLPMTVVNFAVASAVPRLARRWDAAWMLATGVALTLAGMVWLSQAASGTGFLTGIAAPMLLVGAGQGLAFAPLTSFGIVDAPARDAGAASGLVNTFHQFGTTMGLAVLVAVSASAPDAGSRFTDALRGSSLLLVLGLVLILALLVPAHRRHRAA